MDPVAIPAVGEGEAADSHYGLRANVLSPMETLAQSVSMIAPSTSAAMTVPLVFALAGEGTSLAYVLAMGSMLLVALCIATFAKGSASPGSLYVYARSSLPPVFGAMTAWALYFAYVVTAASVIGGFVSFAYVFLGGLGHYVPTVVVAGVAAGVATWVAYRDIQISARLMLWVEVVSVLLIGVVVGMTIWRHGLHLDWPQLTLRGASPSSVRLGVMLAIFSFVGFESATSLGSEAKDPLRTIPRAVTWSALLTGAFFVVVAYGEVLGFRGAQAGLAESAAPMRILSRAMGVGRLGPFIDAGVLVSMFAAALACVISGARLLLLMARHGLVSSALGRTHSVHETPALAGLITGVLSFLPVAWLAERGASGADVYGWMGSLAVYGFLTAYALVSFATLVYGRRQSHGMRTTVLAVLAGVAMVGALVGTLFPVPPPPYRYFPYLYGAYMGLAFVWYAGSRTLRVAR